MNPMSLARGLALACALGLAAAPAQAARQSKVQDTKHNLSSTGTGTVKSGSESEICVFCHTPHHADNAAPQPLWNKTVAAKTYTVYTSNSLDAQIIRGSSLEQPMGSSKLCLSCHDGAMALGSVRVLRGQLNQTITVNNTGTGGIMPSGSGVATGDTRNIGAGALGQTTNFDLTNDHPISITYDSTLANRDGELRVPDAAQNAQIFVNGTNPVFGKRVQGQSASTKPVLPLEPTGASSAGQVQCTTCHDPHLKETDLTAELNIKFLRRNRFQKAQPTASYNDANDIICLACHDKGMNGPGGNSWAYSAHANSQVKSAGTDYTYTTTAATAREFPAGLPVWKASCLNCHDTHTVTGSRRLLRGGVSGANPAIEETCYQCHRLGTESAITPTATLPDIRTDFTTLTYKMPISNASEVHNIGGNFNDGYAGGTAPTATSGSNCSGTTNKCGADFVEAKSLLNSRHAECTDCHNPHRVVKFRSAFGVSGNITGAPDVEGTHPHVDTTSTPAHTNVISGALRGTWGVEPSYADPSFHVAASDYTVRRGDPGSDYLTANEIAYTTATNPYTTADTKNYVTREYQICLKCHSSYAYGTTPPSSGPSIGVNGLTQYTDQAREFQAPQAHADDSDVLNAGTAAGANSAFNTRNHRSWHPVMRPTGRTATKRSVTASSAWNHPFQNVGTQTMYCSDCHGSGTAAGTVVPAGANQTLGQGSPWGPHGSNNAFILKGAWNSESANATTTLCLRCHNPTSSSSFSGGGRGNLHSYHQSKVGLECTWCHIAVPHGWKNRSLLVNLNDVGPEAEPATCPSGGCEVRMGSNSTRTSADYYTKAPYYLEAKNKIRTFGTAGSWVLGDCGSANRATQIPPTNAPAKTTNSTATGETWMKDTDGGVCFSPP